MKSSEIRSLFFSFFKDKNHTIVSSSSLIPAQDPTLLFANAGMNQFKDLFLGLEKRSYTRAVSIQKCVRAGGKHNDLDNVGFTRRHLTFFEMMGNFSFGDYFKKEAIEFAWHFLTKTLQLPTDKLYTTVYKTDDESYDLWNKHIGVPAERIFRLGEKDNFWQMGDVGPCGPCTEIYVDRGASFGCTNVTDCGPGCDCDRFLEIWNLVFMQYDRQPNGQLSPLKQTGVDTGMGLERLCSVIQNVDSVYQTDLFLPIIKKIEELSGLTYKNQPAELKAAFHVLADHIRSTSLLIADGCAPSNEGRGYVLRKIIRRAALFEQKLTNKSIFPQLSSAVMEILGSIYPELVTNQQLIIDVLSSEVNKFATNLVRGQSILQNYFKEQKDCKQISGEQAFKLYDTYGFPIELVHLIAQENGYTVDEQGFTKHMAMQQEQSGKKTIDVLDSIEFDESVVTEFTGYKELETKSTIKALIIGQETVEQVPAGQSCWVIAAESPFFIVGGGQVPDQGWIQIKEHKIPIEQVRYINGRIAAKITTPIALKLGDPLSAIVDPVWRTNAMKNHTATHLLQSALITIFGKTIKQSGSLVHPDYLRFDFTYHANLTEQDIKKVEDLVNKKIQENIPVAVEYLTLKEASDRGALAFFGDKYNPDKVRMVKVDDFSTELCGGTHVRATGDIGCFKITEVSALAAGHRRIVAVTGPHAIELFQDVFNTTKALGHEYKVQQTEVIQAVFKQKDEYKNLQIEYKKLKKQLLQLQIPELQKKIENIQELPVLIEYIENSSHEEMKDLIQMLSDKKPGLYILTTIVGSKTLYVAGLSGAYKDKINLKNMAQWFKTEFALQGGGSALLIQGAGTAVKNLEPILKKWIEKTINSL